MPLSTVSSNSGSDSEVKKTDPTKNEKNDQCTKCIKHIGEIHDFYVRRVLDSTAKQYRIVAAHKRTEQNDLNTTEIDYSIYRYQREPKEFRNGCTIRVPAMFWFCKFDPTLLNDLIVSKGKFSGEKAVCAKQWGSHIFLSNGAEMQTLGCYMNEKHEYTAPKASVINCVYPVLRNFTQASDKPDLVLGSRYSSKVDTKGDRCFGKDLNAKDNADGVWDITEDFLDPSSQSLNYTSKEFSSERRRYAFYVCEDSRLIVTDDRGSGKGSDKLTSSFYQQGSFAIIEVEKGNELVVGLEFYTREKKASKEDITDKGELIPAKCKWHNLGKKAFLDKRWFNGSISDEDKDTNDSNDAKDLEGPKTDINDKEAKNKLSAQRRVVIFLGATESQYNTICWRLEITSSDPKEYILVPPDGGRILDILPWTKGFQQITARHRYQRLFEAVLYPEIHSKLPFTVPEDEKLLKRIFGLCEDDSSLYPIIILDTSKHFKKPKHPEYLKPDIKGYQRMVHIEGGSKRNDWKAIHPYSVQPLHPPITQIDSNENNFLYLRYGTNPVLTDDKHFKIDGKYYEMFVKQIPEYSWKLVGRVSDFKEQFLAKHSKQHRIGVDWMVYETNFETIGTINSAIFFPKKEEVTPVKSTPIT